MRQKITEIFGKTGTVLSGYPMVLLMAFLGAVSLMCFAHGNYSANGNYFVFIRFSLVASLGISLMFALKILSQRIGRGLLLETAGVAFLIFFYFLLPDKEKYFGERYAFLIIPTFILSHLLVSFIAFMDGKKELNFWQYNKNLFINIFLTAVFTGVLTGGVELAILAVDKLFDFNFNDRYYTETFYLLAIFGSCFIFLLFNEKGLKHLEKDGNYPLILKFFTQYILIPLLLIYLVILYFYSAKILINWELPRGWVSYLILAYSLVGIFALLLVYPLKKDSTKSWVKIFSKIFYFTLLPLIILLFTAIFTRILEYGYTEARYFVLLLALWLTSVVLYFIFVKNSTIKYVPVSLFVFGLFALIFPFLNAFSVAKRSQSAELQSILISNNLLKNGKIDFSKKVSDTVAAEVSDKFRFLAERQEKEVLMNFLATSDKKVIAESLNDMNSSGVQNQVRNRFKNVQETKKLTSRHVELVPANKFQDVSGYDYVSTIDSFYDKGVTIHNDVFRIIHTNGVEKPHFEITLNGKEKLDVSEFIRQTADKNKNKTGRFEVPEISTEGELGDYQIKIIFENLTIEGMNGQRIYFNAGYVLFRKNGKK
ncbi:DUF4153 domain-containing protein [Chryseobacterium sp.]|uniref:DUF4153 domain-containing protein n=1 Tax=Chryseobacterium sp. TaxID=1871047 RepID=UPI0011C9D6CE|nr:DUF4153 domain-containing protein [Chryseobacterium sp.]TXF79554.1 DUF4153 domain-containing protein [Chryseobacterium sp.]